MIDKLTGTAGSKIDNTDTIATIKSARVSCQNVYNIAPGEIVDIEASDGRAFVNVKCNPSEVLRYGNLKEVNCKKSYEASIGAQLGVADDYVIFEYCTAWQGQSVYPVRINNMTYYKQDPSDVLDGSYTVRKDGAQQQGYVVNRNRVTFNDEQKALFGENVLDKIAKIRENQAWSTKKSIDVLRQLGVTHRAKNEKRIEETEEDIGEG